MENTAIVLNEAFFINLFKSLLWAGLFIFVSVTLIRIFEKRQKKRKRNKSITAKTLKEHIASYDKSGRRKAEVVLKKHAKDGLIKAYSKLFEKYAYEAYAGTYFEEKREEAKNKLFALIAQFDQLTDALFKIELSRTAEYSKMKRTKQAVRKLTKLPTSVVVSADHDITYTEPEEERQQREQKIGVLMLTIERQQFCLNMLLEDASEELERFEEMLLEDFPEAEAYLGASL